MTICRHILVLCLLVGGLAGCEQVLESSNAAKSDAQASPQTDTVSLLINGRNTDKPSVNYECRHEPGMTVLDLLLRTGEAESVEIKYSGAGETAFVKSINGIVGGENGADWWIYFVNDKLASQGAGATAIDKGDRVEWRLGKYKVDDDSK